MRVLVCGSRHFNDYSRLAQELETLVRPEWSLIIHGAAKGADTLAGLWAKAHKIPVQVFPADWATYGKRAGPIRNHQMLREGKPELVVAFIAPDSRGTRSMCNIARQAGVPVKEINI